MRGQPGPGWRAAGHQGCAQASDCLPRQKPCQVCSPSAYVCPEVACVEGVCVESEVDCAGVADCEPVAAQASGSCGQPLGWEWDGVDCVLLSGCSCEGPGCAELTDSRDGCLAARAACVDPALICAGRLCGAPCSPCPSWELCAPSPYLCGGEGRCVAQNSICPSCQVDAECLAPPAFTCPSGVLNTPKAFCDGGACVIVTEDCPAIVPCSDSSYSQSAVPGCSVGLLGFAWSNDACVEIKGCSCGSGCDQLTATWEECVLKNVGCEMRACQQAADCPVITYCSTCPDGQSNCPIAGCVDGHCAYQVPACL